MHLECLNFQAKIQRRKQSHAAALNFVMFYTKLASGET